MPRFGGAFLFVIDSSCITVANSASENFMRRISIFGVIACLTASPALAADPAPVSLAMDGPWVANYDRDSCQLLAKFKRGEHELIVRFTRFQPGDVFDLALYGSSLGAKGSMSDVAIAFEPVQSLRKRQATTGTYSGGIPMILFSSLRFYDWPRELNQPDTKPTDVTPDQEAAIRAVTIRLDKRRSYRLELGSMREPMAEMRKCLDDLLVQWGYDPKMVATLSRSATPSNNPAGWVTESDYPTPALFQSIGGIVQFRLDVGSNGKVMGCYILSRTSPDLFADMTCRRIKQRARFQPALDSDGNPVNSFFVNKVRFFAPER